MLLSHLPDKARKQQSQLNGIEPGERKEMSEQVRCAVLSFSTDAEREREGDKTPTITEV